MIEEDNNDIIPLSDKDNDNIIDNNDNNIIDNNDNDVIDVIDNTNKMEEVKQIERIVPTDNDGRALLPSQIARVDATYTDELAVEDEVDDSSLFEEEEMGELREDPKIPPNYILIYIHPHLAPPSDWAMADPWPVWLPSDFNQFDIADLLQRLKGIPAHRQAYRFKDGETLNIKQEKWAMKRLGIRDNYVLRLEPTLPDSWLWYPKEHYIFKFIDDLKVVIAENHGFIKLSEALIKVPLPPIIHSSARVLLRKYPELIHIHIDTTYNEAWIMEKKFDRQPPSFSNMPVTLGYTPRIQLPEFSWSEYLDIDDTKPLVLDFPIPDVFFKCIIKRATGLKPVDTHENSSNTYAVFYFNDKKVGQTKYRLLNLNPMWNDAIFDLTCSAEIETKRCVIYIEFFHKSLVEEIEDIFLGSTNLTGQDIEDLIGSGNSSTMELPLEKSRKGSLNAISEVSGTVTLCGGRKGTELNVFSARELTPIANPESYPFAIVIFNGVELIQTLPNRAQRHPVWSETLCIPDISSSQTLDQVTLEIQVWNTSTAKDAAFGTKQDFMGTAIITGEKLVKLFDKNNKYATTFTAPLTQSKTVPFKQRTKPVSGFINIIAGPVGLPMNYGKQVELTIVQVKAMAKVKEFFYVVLWNNIQVFKSDVLTLDIHHFKDENKKDKEVTLRTINEKIMLGSRLEAKSFHDHKLVIEFFGFEKDGVGSYLGNTTFENQELVGFFESPVLQEKICEIGRDKTWEDKFQRQVRGELTLRAGPKDARYENQRLIIIESCSNLMGAKPNGFSNVFVTITWNKVEVAKTYTINDCLSPKWTNQLITLTCPEKPDKKNLQYNGTSSGCNLDIEVWDEVLGGFLGGGEPKKGTFLGGIYLEYDEVAELLEQKEFKEHELQLQVGPTDKKKKIPKPIRGGKVGTDATIKITCLGLKYPSWAGILLERENLLNGVEEIVQEAVVEEIVEDSISEPEESNGSVAPSQDDDSENNDD